jgi:hypothetical protein
MNRKARLPASLAALATQQLHLVDYIITPKYKQAAAASTRVKARQKSKVNLIFSPFDDHAVKKTALASEFRAQCLQR